MIVPVGKNKHQVNQGGLKYESFLNDPNFTKLAADFSDLNNKPNQPGAPVEETASPVEEESPAPGLQDASPVPGLQDAMNQGTDPGMNSGADQGGLKEPGQAEVPPGARFNPMTGEPINEVNSLKLVGRIAQWLAGQKETANVTVQGYQEKANQVTVTFNLAGKIEKAGA